MKLKFEISSAYLSQCVATLHCFLSSQSFNNNSENCSQLESWKSKISYTKNTRMGIKNEKTEKDCIMVKKGINQILIEPLVIKHENLLI